MFWMLNWMLLLNNKILTKTLFCRRKMIQNRNCREHLHLYIIFYLNLVKWYKSLSYRNLIKKVKFLPPEKIQNALLWNYLNLYFRKNLFFFFHLNLNICNFSMINIFLWSFFFQDIFFSKMFMSFKKLYNKFQSL